MALTEQQKQEILKVLSNNTINVFTPILPEFWFQSNSDKLMCNGPDWAINSSCVIPYIQKIDFNISIIDGATVEFPNVTSMDSLSVYAGSSIAALKLERINSCYLEKAGLISLPSIDFIGNLRITLCSVNLPIKTCRRLLLHNSEVILPKLIENTGLVRVAFDSILVLTSSIKRLSQVVGDSRSTIIVPESAFPAISITPEAYYGEQPEIILITGGE